MGVLGQDKPLQKRDASVIVIGLSSGVMTRESTIKDLILWQSMFEKCVLLVTLVQPVKKELKDDTMEDDLFEHQGYAKLMAINEKRIGGELMVDKVKKTFYANVMGVWKHVILTYI